MPEYFSKHLGQPCFVIAANGGLLCNLRMKHGKHGRQGPETEKHQYSHDSAFPSRKASLTKHIESDRHRCAIEAEELQRSSILSKQYDEQKLSKENIVAEIMHMIAWLIKEELANRKLSSLQALVDKVGAIERFWTLQLSSGQ